MGKRFDEAGKDAAEGKEEEPMVGSQPMPADPEFGSGCQYSWPLGGIDAELILWHGKDYNNVEELLEDHPFYDPEMSENRSVLEELEGEKRAALEVAGALDWEYRFFACSAIYAALIHEWLAPSVAYKRHNRDWWAMEQTAPPGKRIGWATWRRLLPFVIRSDTGPTLVALLERNNLVESHKETVRQAFLNEMKSWDWSCSTWGEGAFYRRIGDLNTGRAGLTRVLKILGIPPTTAASYIDQSFSKKRFVPVCDLLMASTPPAPRPPI